MLSALNKEKKSNSLELEYIEHNVCKYWFVKLLFYLYVCLLGDAVKYISYCGLQWKAFERHWASFMFLVATMLGCSTFFPFLMLYYTLLALLGQPSGESHFTPSHGM